MRKILSLIVCLTGFTLAHGQTPNNCGNYTSTGSSSASGYADPNAACGALVPGTFTGGTAAWSGTSCSGQVISTVTGPAVSCLTVSYGAVNTNDFATMSTNTGGTLTITTINCGVSGNVIGPYNCGTGPYGNCLVTVCSTIPFTDLILTNTGCTSGWVINCATTTSCIAPNITSLADVGACTSYTLPAINGTNLSGGEAYFSAPGGTGTQFNPGDVITTSMTMYIYDVSTSPCFDEDTFNITLDTQNPVINPPPNLMANCSITEQPPYVDLTAFQNAGGSASDDTNLDIPTFTLISEVSDGNSCPEIVTRTYEISDLCGNSSTTTQTITINDLINPTASNPITLNVSCVSDVPTPDILVVTDEADNCSVPVVTWVSDASNNSTCNNETITRIYSVTDVCGNSINVTQSIIIDAFIPQVGAGLDQLICDGDLSTLVASNPDGALISWNNGVTDGIPFAPAVGLNTYIVTADICSGACINSDQMTVEVGAIPSVSFQGDNLLGCVTHEVNFTNTSTEQFDCTWDFGDNIQSANCGSVTHSYTQTGIFDVQLTVTSNLGCTASATYASYIEVVNLPVANFSTSANVVAVDDTEIAFTNGSTNSISWLWTFGDSTASSTIEDPSHIFPNQGNGTYQVMLIAYNSIGCADTTYSEVIVQDVILYFVPNIFTPDGDEFNETFQPVFTLGFDPYDFHLTIFDRWGEIMFESYNAISGWDGHYGDGGLVEDGVYIWQIEFKETKSDKKYTEHGHVTVLK
jgi:gliding motility-associated-like protein